MNRVAVAKELVKLARELTADQSPFESALRKAIADAIKKEKRDGTVSMSMDNLMQIVRPPSSSLDGAPRGTNARYFYKQLFRELVEKEFQAFINP